MSDWQPIDEAPRRKGRVILGYFPAQGPFQAWQEPIVWGWVGRRERDWTRPDGEFHSYSPTHWKPLPGGDAA